MHRTVTPSRRSPVTAPAAADRHDAHADRTPSRRRGRRRLVPRATPRYGRRGGAGSQVESRDARSSSRSRAAIARRAPASPRSCANFRACRRSRCSRRSIARRRTPCCRSARRACGRSSTCATPTDGASCAAICSSARGEDIQRQALGQLAIDLAGVPQRLLALLRGAVPRRRRASRRSARFAERLDVLPSTLMSRFFRAQLAGAEAISRDRRASFARRACSRIRASPSRTSRIISTIRRRRASAATCERVMHLTAVQFRERYDGEGMLAALPRKRSCCRTSNSCASSVRSLRRGASSHTRRTRAAVSRRARARQPGMSGTISAARASETTVDALRLLALRARPLRDRRARARRRRFRPRRARHRSPFCAEPPVVIVSSMTTTRSPVWNGPSISLPVPWVFGSLRTVNARSGAALDALA